MTLDRVRRRTAEVPPILSAARDGKQALYSPVESRPPLGAVSFRCRRCTQTSVLTVSQAARAMVPSVHLPLPGPHRSWVRCPACRRRGWVSIRLRW